MPGLCGLLLQKVRYVILLQPRRIPESLLMLKSNRQPRRMPESLLTLKSNRQPGEMPESLLTLKSNRQPGEMPESLLTLKSNRQPGDMPESLLTLKSNRQPGEMPESLILKCSGHLLFVCLFVSPDTSTYPSLWVGTSLGSVLVISLCLPTEGEARRTEAVIVSPSGQLSDLLLKSPSPVPLPTVEAQLNLHLCSLFQEQSSV